MGPADALSRKDEVETSDDNRKITLLKGKNQYFHLWVINHTLAEKISLSSASDPIVINALAAMNSTSREPWIPRTSKEDWRFKDGNLYFKHQLYIPESTHFDLVRSLHESPARGHEGYFCTFHHMQQDYWWPGMSTFLQKYITGCAVCQAAKVNTQWYPDSPPWQWRP